MTYLHIDATFSDGQYKKTVSNVKLSNIIGDFKFTPLEDGISHTVEWFKRNYENARK